MIQLRIAGHTKMESDGDREGAGGNDLGEGGEGFLKSGRWGGMLL